MKMRQTTKLKMRKQREKRIKQYFDYVTVSKEYYMILKDEDNLNDWDSRDEFTNYQKLLSTVGMSFDGIIIAKYNIDNLYFLVIYNEDENASYIIKLVYTEKIVKLHVVSQKWILKNIEIVKKILKMANEEEIVNKEYFLKLKLSENGIIKTVKTMSNNM